MRYLVLIFALLVCRESVAQQYVDIPWDSPKLSLHLPMEVRKLYQNFGSGSCVQCSIGMDGNHQMIEQMAYLLWKSEHGPPVHGGSWPSRVADYCRERQIPIYNVTGRDTWEWMRWATANGRGCAFGAGRAHFQLVVGRDDKKTTDPKDDLWYVVNNNGSMKTQEYTDESFRRLHLASGQWCVVLDTHCPPAPWRVRAWWK